MKDSFGLLAGIHVTGLPFDKRLRWRVFFRNGLSSMPFRRSGPGHRHRPPGQILQNAGMHPLSEIYRGYSNFLLNMAFISPSEVENIYIS